MKKNNKKIIIIVISLIAIIGLFGLVYFVMNSRNSNSLSLEENKWIDSNKQNVIDVALINDIPILSYEGEGVVYNYLDYVSKNNHLILILFHISWILMWNMSIKWILFQVLRQMILLY